MAQTKTRPKTADRLKGKRVYYYRDPGGFRSGIVKRVEIYKKTGKIKALKVLSSCNHRYRLTVEKNFNRALCGVMFRKKLQPITDWQEVAA